MDRKHAKRVLTELTERAGRSKRLDAQEALFGPQRNFAEDRSKLVAACCSRRAGKSFAVAFKLAKWALAHERAIVPYITMTREDAKNIIWPAFVSLDARFDLGLRFRENNGDVVFRNGSKVILRGASSRREIEKLRGPKYPGAAIDEAQGYSALLFDLIDDILEPATLDYPDSQILVTGTPNAACAGPFFDLLHSDMGWSGHGWTVLDNPHIPHAAEWLDKLRARRHWGEDHPTYLREYRGRWVRDSEGLVFAYSQALNAIPRPNETMGQADDWEYVLGIDLGFNDPTAFVVIASSEYLEKAVVVESYKEEGLIPSAVAAHVERLVSKYHFNSIVADTGGFGKGYVEEMKQKFHLPVKAAQKADKATFISYLNGDLRSGTLLISQAGNEDLLSEIGMLQWDQDSLDSGKPKVDDRRFQDHLCDALLYAWRECRYRGADLQEEAPRVGSAEWLKAEEAAMEREQERLLEERQRPWIEREGDYLEDF